MRGAVAALFALAVAASPTIARADDEATGEAAPPPKFVPRVEVHAAGGPAVRGVFGLPLVMGTGELGVRGRVLENLAVGATFGYEEGTTPHGLRARMLTLTPSLDAVFDRFRVGVGVPIAGFAFWRVTDGSAITPHLGIGLRASASFDVVTTDSVAVFLGARGEIEWMFPSAILGGTGLLGIRFAPRP